MSTILKNVTASWVSLSVNLVLSFFIAPITVNALGNVYYGIWTLLMQFTGYLWLFDFGVRESVVKYVAQYHASGDRDQVSLTVRTALSIYGLVAVLAMIGVIGLTIALPYAFNIPPEAVSTARIAAFLTGATIAQSFVFNVFVGIVIGLQQYYRLTTAALIFTFLRTGLIYVLLVNGQGIVALAAVQFLMSCLFSVVIYRVCRQELPYLSVRPLRPPREAALKLLNYGKFVLAANIGDKIVFGTDSIVIATFLPVSYLTFYAIGGSLIEYFRSFIGSMSSVINPLASSLEALNDGKLLSRLFIAAAKAAVVLGLPVCIGFIILGERFISLWMGPEFGPQAGQVLAILAVGYIAGLPYRTMSAVLYGMGKHHYVAYSRLVEGAVNLALSIALIKSFGLAGVAFGTALPHIIVVVFYLPSIMPKLLPLSLREYYSWVYMRPMIASVPFVVLCWLIEHVLAPSNLLVFMASVLAALVAYAIPCWYFVLVDDERQRVARLVFRAMPFVAPPVKLADPVRTSK